MDYQNNFDPLMDFGNDQPMDWGNINAGLGSDSGRKNPNRIFRSSERGNRPQWSSGNARMSEQSGVKLKQGWFLPEDLGFKEEMLKGLTGDIFNNMFIETGDLNVELQRMRRSLNNRFVSKRLFFYLIQSF